MGMARVCRSCQQKVNQSSTWCPWCGERVYPLVPWRLVGGILIAVMIAATLIYLISRVGDTP